MLNQDFKEFIESLNARQVRYLVVGGYAVALHGHPRYTKDIDIWLDRDPENAERVLRALDRIIQLGYAPNRIDLLTTLADLDFGACYASHLVVTIDHVDVNFIDLENPRASKRSAGRLQDLVDLENLG